MGKIKWKTKEDIENEEKLNAQKEKEKLKYRGRNIRGMTQDEQLDLLERIAKQTGYL